MLQLKNHSPFSPAISLFPDEEGVDTLYVMIKATFVYNKGVQLAEEQVPVQMEDEYWGEPGKSSIRYMSEMHLGKCSTDIVVIGHACSPERRLITEMDCGIRVGNYEKVMRVFGNRYWSGFSKSKPEPFSKIPLIFEHAYGGAYLDVQANKKGEKELTTILHEVNPVGRGYYKQGKQSVSGDSLPNIEDPKKLLSKRTDNPSPACFGFVSPVSKPRIDYAGTYDAVWQKERAPYLPKDFDKRFFNAAAPELTCQEYLLGGESVVMIGLHSDGAKKFVLPRCDLNCKIDVDGRTEKLVFNLETVLFEPDKVQFSITFRASLRCDKENLKVKEVHIYGSWDGSDDYKNNSISDEVSIS